MLINELTEEQVQRICKRFLTGSTYQCHGCPFAILVCDDYWVDIDENGKPHGGHYECASYILHEALDDELVDWLNEQ